MPGSLRHVRQNPWAVARILLGDKTVYRAHTNLALRRVRLAGSVLDLGSKSTSASYYRYMQQADDCQVTCTDLAPGPGVVCLDVEKRFELPSEGFDLVLAFNLFEHVRHFERAPSEIFRVLKPGGAVHVVVPFMHEFHADPDDYFRYTDSALRSIWEDAGFRTASIDALGDGILTYAVTKVIQQLLPRPLRPGLAALFYLLCYPVDRLVGLRRPIDGRRMPERFPLGYLATFRKPENASGAG